MERKRIVVTGMGCISPIGNSVDEAWNSVRNGKSGISRITLFDTSRLRVHIAGEVKNFNSEDYGIPRKSTRKMARFTQYALAATT